MHDGLGSRVGLYFRNVGTHALGTVPEFYHLPLSHGVLVRFLRFRLGCHHLRVNTGRWVQPPLPRRQRVCLRCHSACLDDEVCSHGCVPLSALVKYVAVFVRVCWYCHQSGGTDVVDLPDILLPAGQCLDMFDSESETDHSGDSSDEELVEV